ncbi:primosomal protein N' [Lacticaseibacillus jixianensis]|uniref:Replication restart protein PriA n=1 Tax=Lacticaseibacillus jixianensis TaxID=2486012 RepID=A0ABW4B9K0_9LACO|nr:primosomal protein N' [Lacticaseibacillus jixianensis]
MTVAKVIVDVPTMQTDRPFDYAIPPALSDRIQPGMRVWVQFGQGKREVSGMVVALADHADYAGELKPVIAALDYAPVMNQETLALSHWLAQTTYAFWITCIQTMLPAMLKVDTIKSVTLGSAPTPEAKALLDGQERLVLDSHTDPAVSARVMRLIDQQALTLHYARKDRAKVKTEQVIVPLKTAAEYAALRETVRANATKQLQLITALRTWVNAHQTPVLAQAVKAGDVDRAATTAAAKKGWLKLVAREVYRAPYDELDHGERTQPLTLTADQAKVVRTVNSAVQAKQPTTFLLEGVTGSGKTEVYLQVIAAALKMGRNAMMLVPEIALTPQMVHRVKGRFGREVAVMHSGLSEGEKFDEWRRIQRGEAQVVVGARSAAFAPLTNIGVFIIDEEHETSYKQDDAPRYHARDVVLHRAQTFGAPVVLGSATPSLESRARAEKGVYTLLKLPHRINQQPLPQVHVIDMREAYKQGGKDDFSKDLLDALQTRLDRREQSVLLLNKRGFSSFVMCRECGYRVQCPNCDISLTLHMDTRTLRCHYCGHEEAIPTVCPSCGSRRIRYYGTGTEKVEASLHQLLPMARVLRMDVDTTRRKGGHEKILAAFGAHEADILLGTQMIAKGLDFPDVTLVGVINADTGLGMPDFRASERTFDLLTQVSGRAGRAEKPGEVFIQTFNPDHYAIQYAKLQDYEGFFRQEMAIRHRADYPPYYFTTKVTVSHQQEAAAAKLIYQLAKQLQDQLSPKAIVLGPTPGPIARLKNRYLYQLVIKYKQEPRLAQTLTQILDETQVGTRNGYFVGIDKEPLTFI